MKPINGIHHKRSIEDILISVFQVTIVTLILSIVALVAVDAFVKEDIARVEKLRRHFYEVSMSMDATGPAAPTGVRPNYGESSESKVRFYQDASQRAKAVK